ncbi:formate dehydrogenase accessory protein FdhE [Sulfuriferula sp. GW1]|uniref:formate dehydrogenase accessory protein FdhE n=1 Tax=Sulfuriferula sp. GW1 TaxID=3345111 RepID=UPI0039AEA251
MATTIIEPGFIQPPSIEPPFLRQPNASVLFGERSRRLMTLAEGHTMADFLRFMGHLAEAQQHALNNLGTPKLPDAEQIMLCKTHGMPPLGTQTLLRDASWREGLSTILKQVSGQANAATQAAIVRIQALSETELEVFADRLLSGDYAGVDLAAAPLIGAALQVYWVRLASALEPDDFPRPDVHTLCPACGSLPTASVVRIGGVEQGLRYLHCSLCESEWNMVRIKCSHCESTKGIAYFNIDGGDEAVKAETCDECNSYLKIFYMEKNMAVDPIADDLASLALDILMDEAGYQRSGPNLLLFPGSHDV